MGKAEYMKLPKLFHGGRFEVWSVHTDYLNRADQHAVDFWKREAEAQLKAKRMAQDECERLEGELAIEVRKREFSDALSALWAGRADLHFHERDEARRVARGLWWLARAYYAFDVRDGERLDIWAGLAALEPGVRRIVEEG
jgi:hypothetical protein